MKHCFLFLALACSLSVLSSTDQFQIIIKPTWQDLDCDAYKCKQFGGKWVLVSAITFKKKSKDPVELHKLALKWHGDHIEHLTASLYYTNTSEADFMPIEENLVCDSEWCTKNQTLILRFINQETLGALNSYYLVLTIPPELEQIVQHGYFLIDHTHLPEQFKQAATDNTLRIHLDVLS